MNRNHFTKKSNQKKLIMKTTAVSLCTVMLAGASCPVYAADTERIKDENIYVTLKDDGSVANVYIVNEFTSKNAGEVTDYGDYRSVKNLTTDDPLEQNGEAVTMEVPKGKFYYQGNVESTEIPWNIKIQYTLDGKAISAEDLAGKEGHLVIKIDTSENKAGNSTFFENYLLQATVVLNTEKCSNITAGGATAGNVGKNRQLVYNIMAGQEKEIEISADVENFEMDAISFQGVPMSFDIDEDSIDLSKLTDQTTKLQDAVATLDDGAGSLKDGEGSLKDGVDQAVTGSQTLLSGTQTLASGVGALANGGSTLQSGTESLLSGAVSLNQGIDQCVNGSHSLAEGSKTLTSGLLELKTQVDGLAASANSNDAKQLMVQLQQLQSSLTEISSQAGAISQLLNQNAQIIGAVAAEHQQVLANLNQQVAAINNQAAWQSQSLQNSANNVNAQINQAIAAIDTSLANGAIDAGTAESLKVSLNASRVDVIQEGNIGMVVMPDEDGALNQQLQIMTASAAQLSQASVGFQMAAEQLIGAGSQLNAVINMSAMVGQLQSAVTSAYEGAAALEAGSTQLDVGTQQLKSESQSFVLGVSQVNDGTKNLVGGIQSVESGSNSLVQGTIQLTTGLDSLASGTGELKNGTDTLKNGTEEFKDQTKDMDEQIDNEIKDMLDKIAGSDYEPVSFASTENTDIGLVQFAIRTDEIKIADEEEKPATEEKETILDKIKNLF